MNLISLQFIAQFFGGTELRTETDHIGHTKLSISNKKTTVFLKAMSKGNTLQVKQGGFVFPDDDLSPGLPDNWIDLKGMEINPLKKDFGTSKISILGPDFTKNVNNPNPQPYAAWFAGTILATEFAVELEYPIVNSRVTVVREKQTEMKAKFDKIIADFQAKGVGKEMDVDCLALVKELWSDRWLVNSMMYKKATPAFFDKEGRAQEYLDTAIDVTNVREDGSFGTYFGRTSFAKKTGDLLAENTEVINWMGDINFWNITTLELVENNGAQYLSLKTAESGKEQFVFKATSAQFLVSGNWTLTDTYIGFDGVKVTKKAMDPIWGHMAYFAGVVIILAFMSRFIYGNLKK
jgi:hypothetical protein